ncbi:MAG TPA: helix-turn-helix transcriptional regulator [Kofleriaceae bacterium]|nr:helix-turn-helix transcriptional regulator [Kofleriaceae bacterium]
MELSRVAEEPDEFRRRLRGILTRLVSFDAYCVNTADPATLLVTGSIGDGLPPDRAARLFEIEYLVPDFSKMAELAVGPKQVAVLGDETDRCPERSTRMRDVFLPIGYAHELRCALRVGGSCWGYLHLLRAHERDDFSPREAEAVRRIASDIAYGLRLGILKRAAGCTSTEVGVVLLSDCSTIVDSMNPAAMRWLDELKIEPSQPLPHSVLAVAQRSRTFSGDAPNPASCRVQTRAGRWLSIHGTRIGGRVAVILETARPSDVAQVILLAYELTQREGRVVHFLLRGMSNDEIAVELGLSTYTVKDHLKAIFRKTGARSRAELSARIFNEQHLPRIAARTAIAPSGWFAD